MAKTNTETIPPLCGVDTVTPCQAIELIQLQFGAATLIDNDQRPSVQVLLAAMLCRPPCKVMPPLGEATLQSYLELVA